MNESELQFCRKTRMMVPKRSTRQPVLMVSRVQHALVSTQHQRSRPCNNRNRANREAHEWNRYDDLPNKRWDTESKACSDDYDDIPSQQVLNYRNGNSDMQPQELFTNRQNHNYSYPDRYEQDHRRESTQDRHNNRGRTSHNTPRISHNRGKNNINVSDYSSDDDGHDVRSGISARLNSNVSEQLVYPQFLLGQISGFIGQNINFHQLNYEQFIANELSTIVNLQNVTEICGCTKLLHRVSLWKLRANVTWQKVHNAYAHIVHRIENKEIMWEANWDDYERHIYDKVVNSSVGANKMDKVKKQQSEFTYFCKSYQKTEGCRKESPHDIKIGNVFRQVHHICTTCWCKDRSRKEHSKSSSECPYREA